MKFGIIIAFGAAFVVAGLLFCVTGIFLGRPESVRKAPISKPSSTVFHAIGALTLATGIVFLAAGRHFSKAALQAVSVGYLALLTAAFAVLSLLIRGNGK